MVLTVFDSMLSYMILRCRQIPKLSCRTTAETVPVANFLPPQPCLADFARFLLILCAVKPIVEAQSANRTDILVI